MTTFLREAFRVKRKSHLERIRAALFLAIKRTAANLDTCVKVPGKDFSRTRKLPLQAMLGRQYKRYQNPVSAVAFQYRFS